MFNLQYQALNQYSNWLNLPYQAHLTVRLSQPNRSSQQLNRDLIRSTLVPLQQYCQTRIAATTVILRSHAHCLLCAPDSRLDLQQLQRFAASKGLVGGYGGRDGLPGFAGDPKVTVTEIYPNSAEYDFEHLISQDATLHFFNINYLDAKRPGPAGAA